MKKPKCTRCHRYVAKHQGHVYEEIAAGENVAYQYKWQNLCDRCYEDAVEFAEDKGLSLSGKEGTIELL